MVTNPPPLQKKKWNCFWTYWHLLLHKEGVEGKVMDSIMYFHERSFLQRLLALPLGSKSVKKMTYIYKDFQVKI